MRVAEDQRAPREHEVEVAVAVGVLEPGAFAARDETGRAPDAAERAHRAVDAAGKNLPRLGEEVLGCGSDPGRADVGHAGPSLSHVAASVA